MIWKDMIFRAHHPFSVENRLSWTVLPNQRISGEAMVKRNRPVLPTDGGRDGSCFSPFYDNVLQRETEKGKREGEGKQF